MDDDDIFSVIIPLTAAGNDPADQKNDPPAVASLKELVGQAAARPDESVDKSCQDSVPDIVQIMVDGRPLLPGSYTSINESARTIFPLIAENKHLFYRALRAWEIRDGKLVQMDESAFRSRVEYFTSKKTWKYLSNGKGEILIAERNMSRDDAAALLSCREAADYLPPIRTVSRSPILLYQDGEPLQTLPGYNEAAGGIYVTGTSSPCEVPFDEAVQSLLGLFDDYDFVEAADRSRALAAYLTPELAAGGWINGSIPVAMVEAKESQSGKTLMLHVRALIHGDVCQVVVDRKKGVGSLDESLSKAFLSGGRFPLLDNFRGAIDSPLLEAAITTPTCVPIRVAHSKETDVDISSSCLGLSSNGVEMTRDLANRCCIIRISKQEDGYRYRDYPEGTLKAHVEVNAMYYLGCIHAILRQWAQEGCPRNAGTGHDFREWGGSRILD
jgi:hypothetical protein